MKRIAHLLKTYTKRLARPFTATKPVAIKSNATVIEKKCLNCSKKKDTTTAASDKGRISLHEFLHFYSDN